MTVSASGASPFQFNIGSGNQTNGAFSNLAAGIYTITITDANGCTSTRGATITQPNLAVSSLVSSQTNITCFGGTNGAFTITASGGVSPYLFNRGTGNQTNANFTNLSAGTYNVTVTDANGCNTVQNLTLVQPNSGVTATVNPTNVTCFGNANGTIDRKSVV